MEATDVRVRQRPIWWAGLRSKPPERWALMRRTVFRWPLPRTGRTSAAACWLLSMPVGTWVALGLFSCRSGGDPVGDVCVGPCRFDRRWSDPCW